MIKLIMLIILSAIACAPLPDVVVPTVQPSPTPAQSEYLNDNPELSFGECVETSFDIGWGRDYIQQCTPRDYTLYQDSSIPIRVGYTGAAYSIRPRGSKGAIGFTLPTMRLDEGCYLIKMSGDAHVWGKIGDYWIQANWRSSATQSPSEMGRHTLRYNGEYMAMFVLDAPGRNDYIVDLFLWLQFASMTDDSYLTIKTITVENVDNGYCG